MTHLVERLTELQLHLDHLEQLQTEVPDAGTLRENLSLHNDVLFSLLMVCQLVIDLAGELSAAKGLRFESYTEAVRNLVAYEGLSEETVETLAKLPGFRNVVIHEYVFLDMDRAFEALHQLEPVRELVKAVRNWVETDDAGGR
jgi:uncharacterized protein YutE (UPF0331/DUF86 family)